MTDAIGGHVDLLDDRRPIGRGGEGPDDAGRAQDGDAAEDPQALVAGPLGHLLTSGHAEGDHHRAIGDLGQGGEDHATRHRVDGRGPDGETQPRFGDGAHALTGGQLRLRLAVGSPTDIGGQLCSIGAIRVVAGIFDHSRSHGARIVSDRAGADDGK